MNTYRSLEQGIGKSNIFRVAHDLDPISLVAPYPYIHTLPSPTDANNMTLLSPTGKLLSTANHDMAEYIRSVGNMSWDGVRGLAGMVQHDDALVSRWLLHGDNPSWLRRASARTLAVLFKLFAHVLRHISTSVIIGLTAVDLLAEILLKGLHKAKQLGARVFQLLKYAAQWAGIKATEYADFTATVVKEILGRMLSALRDLSHQAVAFASRNITPISIGMGAGWLLTASSAF